MRGGVASGERYCYVDTDSSKLGREAQKLGETVEQVENAMIAHCGMNRHWMKSPNPIQQLLNTSTGNLFCASMADS